MAKGKTYVIEHMEPPEADEHSFAPWVTLEYSHMLAITAEPNASEVIFSSLGSSSEALKSQLGQTSSSSRCTCSSQTVGELMKSKGVKLERVCLLDPRAEKELSPEDADEFDWFLFGGILGDDPPRDRTSELRVQGFPGRRLGPVQLTTDTAVLVTKLVVEDGKDMATGIPYVDHPTITFNAHESVEMPFRYVVNSKGEPTLPEGMRELLREDMNKGFDF